MLKTDSFFWTSFQGYILPGSFLPGSYILPGSFLSLCLSRFRSRGISSLNTESWNQFQLRWSGWAPVHSYLSDLGKRAKRKIRFPGNAPNKPETQQFERRGRTNGKQMLWDSKHQEVAWLWGNKCYFSCPVRNWCPLWDSVPLAWFPRPWLDLYVPQMCPQPTLTCRPSLWDGRSRGCNNGVLPGSLSLT